jgi:serine/threonine protein kinase
VHRDIKLENVIVDNFGSIKLIDFGFAADSVESMVPRRIIGSPCYIAPEMLRGESYNESVDLFSIGTTIYTILYGKMPFVGKNVDDRLKNNKKCNITLKSYPSETESELFGFLNGLMTRDAGARMTSSQALSHPWLAAYIQ